jgi:hypothetical protein
MVWENPKLQNSNHKENPKGLPATEERLGRSLFGVLFGVWLLAFVICARQLEIQFMR